MDERPPTPVIGRPVRSEDRRNREGSGEEPIPLIIILQIHNGKNIIIRPPHTHTLTPPSRGEDSFFGTVFA